jgi:predicted transcriptional regulator
LADTESTNNPLELATDVTIAWLANPNTRATASDVDEFFVGMHETARRLASAPEQEQQEEQVEATPDYTPAVSVRKSLASNDHIISLIDGKPYKTLRRHLSVHGLTPEQYRQRYKLPADYPMVARSYSEKRRDMAKTIGLGRKPKVQAEPQAEAEPQVAKIPRRRKVADTPVE